MPAILEACKLDYPVRNMRGINREKRERERERESTLGMQHTAPVFLLIWVPISVIAL